MQPQIDPSQIFIRNWEIYQKVIRENYMKHLELGEAAQKHLQIFVQHSPIRMLDIGCGDAHQISEQLKPLNLSTYTGYDLSEQATKFAEKHFSEIEKNAKFQIGRMEELIKKDHASYNVVYSSFAIHHLNDNEKKEIIEDIYHKLEANGLFILIDIKRLPRQSIDGYKKSYAHWINEDWHALDKDEKNAIIDHLNTCDIPVETQTYVEYALDSGFSLLEEVNVDSRHALLAFIKND
jgi:2-polyprenyl-3-methyl-5-hydroxy-6-metoxy-1,4-benzoquinol methylase